MAHGNSYNDARFFIRDLICAQYDEQEIESVIDGFVDTQMSFQTKFTGKRSFNLGSRSIFEAS